MDRYKNLTGGSSVIGYEIGDGSITVQFKDRTEYLYTTQSAGAPNIAAMLRLAVAGSGLNSFIGRTVRNKYAKRLR
jgi:hypothetical protein